MTTVPFEITQTQLQTLISKYPNLGKNADVGKFAVEVVKLYYLSLDENAEFKTGRGIDIEVCCLNKNECFEVKGTVDKDISWNKLKVSSQDCHDALVNGMQIIRVTNIGQLKMMLYFLTHNIDFTMAPEPRWSLRKA